MPTASIIDFPPFQLDLRAGQLRNGNTALPLRPKTFAVLQLLAERPGQLVTKRALLDGVWGDVAVSEDVVRLSVGELRAALGDQRTAPRFIETVPRRGYRFIARMHDVATGALPSATTAPPSEDGGTAHLIVGRTNELAQIAERIRLAADGTRQIVFVTGEAGIGKTTLVDRALADPLQASAAGFRLARGQCIEHYGGGEPYLPLLEAVTSLCRGADRDWVKGSLRKHAPEWLLRVTGLLKTAHQPAEPVSGTQEHTLHSLAACLEALAADVPLVLVLEDVQWSDYSTLDVLSLVARRETPARLVVLCTLRPADAIACAHPVMGVKRELVRKRLSREIPLAGLSAADVASYLALRFPTSELPADLLDLLLNRSDGNPFFLVALVDHLVEHGLLVKSGDTWVPRAAIEALRTAVPDSLRAVVEPRLEALPAEELAVLQGGSVAGPEFAAHIVAHTMNVTDVEHVEQRCEALVRRQEIIRAAGESTSPDGTRSARYAFRHAFYQQVIYQGLSSTTRRRLHQTIGETLETAYRGRTEDVASELAAHFERSRDVDRAVRYHGEASRQARARSAYGESRLHVEAALDLMRGQPETTDRLKRLVPLLGDFAWASFALKGWGDESAARAFAQMRELAERMDGDLARFRAMEGQLVVHVMRAEYAIARVRGAEMLTLAEQLGNKAAMIQAIAPIGAALIHLGELQATYDIAERGWALCDPEAPTIQGISTCHLLASACTNRGLLAQARAWNNEALALAARVDLPYIRAHATNFVASIYQIQRDATATRPLADETVSIANEHGFTVLRATASIMRAWCDIEAGHARAVIPVLRAALDEYVATGQRITTTSYMLPLIEAHLAAGDAAAANDVLDSAFAFVAETHERIYEHELYRLRGESLLVNGASRGQLADAIGYFEKAMTIAVQQHALLFELRAATSLYRIEPAARARLTALVDRFGAENDCTDVRAARAVLSTR